MDETPGIERQMASHNFGHSIFSVFFIGSGPRLGEAVRVKEQAVARAEIERLRRILPAAEQAQRKARGLEPGHLSVLNHERRAMTGIADFDPARGVGFPTDQRGEVRRHHAVAENPAGALDQLVADFADAVGAVVHAPERRINLVEKLNQARAVPGLGDGRIQPLTPVEQLLAKKTAGHISHRGPPRTEYSTAVLSGSPYDDCVTDSIRIWLWKSALPPHSMLGRFLRLDAVELGSDSGRLRGKLHSRQTPPDAKDYLFAAVFGRVEWRGRISQALPVKKGEVLGNVD